MLVFLKDNIKNGNTMDNVFPILSKLFLLFHTFEVLYFSFFKLIWINLSTLLDHVIHLYSFYSVM